MAEGVDEALSALIIFVSSFVYKHSADIVLGRGSGESLPLPKGGGGGRGEEWGPSPV